MKKIFTCLFIAALCLGKTQTLHAQVNVQDSLVLVDLYKSTHGNHWNNHTNWLTTAPVNTWYGIVVNNERVVKIVLPYNHLAGNITSSLGNLSILTTLDLSGNQLSGPIPASLGNLSKLQRLILYSNQLSDSIPSSLGNLHNLQALQLGSNQLNGTITSSLGNLFNLIVLDLARNQLTGAIPSSLGKLSNLQRLLLSINQLSETIPSSLSNLSHLRDLELDNNQLSGTIPSSLGNLSNLTFLSLTYNQLSGDIPSSLRKLSNLKYLVLSNNQLSGVIPSSLGKLSNLTELYLDGNQLIGTIPLSLGNLPHLSSLSLNNNQLSGTIPASLDSLSLSAVIFVNSNRFTFAGMEGLVEANYSFTNYAPQAHIPMIQKNDSILSVDAGGTLSNNTYKWFKDGVLVKKSAGDKNFTATGPGKYNVVVSNSICTKLTLYSDTITITGFSADKNVISKTNTKTFIYPNPANNFIHLTLDKPTGSNTTATLYNMQGKVLMQQRIAAGSITQQYSTSNLAAGNYLLVIIESGKKIHEERMVIVR